MIEQVRRFNRAVTQRAGALEDAFLARARPLGQARVLWEIGPDGRDVRELRARLGLDSGYLSRLLRALEQDGLITVGASEADGRCRTARLTAEGQAERAELDRRSDDAAAALLGPLSGRQRERLVAAMAEVERMLAASAVEIGVRDPAGPGRPPLPARLRSGAVRAVRRRVRPGPEHLRRRPRADPAGRGCSWSRSGTASRWAAAP